MSGPLVVFDGVVKRFGSITEPEMLLLDEPLSALDAHLVIRMQGVLARLQRELGITFVYVTHSQSEAFAMADRVVIMGDGDIAQIGPPREVYRAPATRFVAEFIGRPAMNTLEGRIEGGVFRADGFSLPVAGRNDGNIVFGIRPEHITPHLTAREGTLACRLDVLELVEPDMLLFTDCGGQPLVVRGKADFPELTSGAELYLELPADRLHFFDAGTGLRLP